MRILRTLAMSITLAALITACGGSSKTAPTTGAVDDSPSPVPPSASATPSPSPTPVTSPTPTDPISALHPIPMREGPPITLPGNTVLHYFGGKVPIEGVPDTLLRAYALSSGQLVVEDVLRSLPVKGRPYGFAFDAHFQRIAVAICAGGDCSDHFKIASRTTEDVILLTEDGGATWKNLGAPPAPDAYLAGFDGQFLLVGLRPGSRMDGTQFNGVLLPNGGEVVGPPGRNPAPVGEHTVGWIRTDDSSLVDRSGGTVIRPALQLPGLNSYRSGRLTASPPDIANGYAKADAANHAIIEIDAAGGPLRAVRFGDFDLAPVARLSPDLIIVNRVFPPGGGLGDAAILNLATGEYRQIAGLRRPTDRDAYPIALSAWPFARITSGPDCLNVREKPSVDAASVGCFANGVLLRVTGPATSVNDRDWLPVEAPGSGEHGYAAAEFLQR